MNWKNFANITINIDCKSRLDSTSSYCTYHISWAGCDMYMNLYVCDTLTIGENPNVLV